MSTRMMLTARAFNLKKALAWMLLSCVCIFSCKTPKDAAGNRVEKAEKKKTLYAVYMKTLRVDAFPKYDRSGEDWDAYAPFATAPDLYVSIAWNNTSFYKSETHQECVFGTPIEYTTGLPIELMPFDQALLVEVFDEDGVSSNDNVGYFSLKLMDYKDWKTVQLKSTDGMLVLTMDLEWVYQ